MLLSCLLAACGSTGNGTGSPATATTASTATEAQATTSTGVTATAPPTEPTVPLTAIRMLDLNNGWALTSKAILRTSDGGKIWHDITPAGAALNSVTKGDFLNAQAAWIAIPNINANTVTILRTLNGGQSWNTASFSVPSPDGLDVPHFRNLQEGWLEVITNGGPGAGSESADIWHSTDGGAHWQRLASTDTPSSGLTREGFKSGISFRDALNGWATTSSDTGRPQNPGLYVTHDGGKTWQNQKLGFPAGQTPQQMGTTPPVFFGNTGLMPVNITLPTIQSELVLYVTHDGGTSWTPTTPAPLQVSTVYVIDPQHAWASATQTGDFFFTNDGGQSWQDSKSNPGPINAMSFVDPANGWAITSSGLLHRSNGGPWTTINYSIDQG